MTTPEPKRDVLAELEKLIAEATPGPWEIKENIAGYHIDGIDRAVCYYEPDGSPRAQSVISRNNAAFIAAARNYLPKLLAVARCADYFINIPDYAEGMLHKKVALRDALSALSEGDEK
jgi:hypothetical protein